MHPLTSCMNPPPLARNNIAGGVEHCVKTIWWRCPGVNPRPLHGPFGYSLTSCRAAYYFGSRRIDAGIGGIAMVTISATMMDPPPKKVPLSLNSPVDLFHVELRRWVDEETGAAATHNPTRTLHRLVARLSHWVATSVQCQATARPFCQSKARRSPQVATLI